MLVIAYGILALIGVGVYLLGFCFFELSKIHRTLLQRNEIAAAYNDLYKQAMAQIIPLDKER